MKTTSLKRSKKPNGGAQGKITLAVFVCIILVAVQWIFPSLIFRFLYAISTPFTTVRDAIGSEFSSIGIYFNSKESLASHNAELEKDLSAINARLLSMEALQSENQALQTMVASKQANVSPKNTVFAAVVERPPFSPYDSLIISSGSASGITAGNPVFDENGTPIGTIENVFPTSAKILLFSNPNTTLHITIGSKKATVTAQGIGGGNFTLKIPVTNEPRIGDAVYIPEFSPLAVGIIKNVSAQPTDTFATILFSFPENIFEISFVTVDTASHFSINIDANATTTTGK